MEHWVKDEQAIVINEQFIEECVNQSLTARGFKRSGRNWRMKFGKSLLSVRLLKSHTFGAFHPPDVDMFLEELAHLRPDKKLTHSVIFPQLMMYVGTPREAEMARCRVLFQSLHEVPSEQRSSEIEALFVEYLDPVVAVFPDVHWFCAFINKSNRSPIHPAVMNYCRAHGS